MNKGERKAKWDVGRGHQKDGNNSGKKTTFKERYHCDHVVENHPFESMQFNCFINTKL